MFSNIVPISPRPFLAAESPIWDDRSGCAYYVDIKGQALFAWSPDRGELQEWPVGQDIGFVALTQGVDLILGLRNGLALFDPNTEQLRPFTEFSPEEDARINDGKVGPDGSLFFGTMALDAAAGRGSLYCLSPKLKLTKIESGYGVPNGPAFSGKETYYHCATDERRIDIHTIDGEVWSRKPFFDVPENIGLPDGVEFDDLGRLWCGLWGGAGLLVVEPEELETTFCPVPATYVTSMSPIGVDGRKLMITSAAAPVLRGERAGAQHEGRVFIAELERPWYARARRFGAGNTGN